MSEKVKPKRTCDNCDWYYDLRDGCGVDCQHPEGPSGYCSRWKAMENICEGADE